MPRNVPTVFATHLAGGTTTVCSLLKIKPSSWSSATMFGLTTLDTNVVYDDGSGDGPITYLASYGYTPMDIDTHFNLSVDNTEAAGLLAPLAADGITAAGIAGAAYDCARFVQYVVNYNNLTSGQHVILNSGQVGQVTNLNGQKVSVELRSLIQILKQTSIIELTSITDRAAYGDARNKMTLHWYNSSVASLGAEDDRDFIVATIPGYSAAPGEATATVSDVFFFTGDGVTTTGLLVDTAGQPVGAGFVVTAIMLDGVTKTAGTNYAIGPTGIVTFAVAPVSGAVGTWSGTLPVNPDGYFVPGVVHWLTGANAARENELESYVAATGAIALAIPTWQPIAPGDTFQIRRDSDGSKTRAIADDNLPNMRAETELPRADGLDLQSPTAGG